jgi:hypothetical protein
MNSMTCLTPRAKTRGLQNFKSYISKLKNHIWVPTPLKNTFTSSFCFPIIAESKEQRDRIVKSLTEHNIECRPLICGSMGTQPFYIEKYERKELPNSKKIDECGFYVPNHPYLTKEEIDTLVNDTSPIIIDGYDRIDKFMHHVFGTTCNYSTSASSSSSTDKIEYINTVVLAHNFRGYDGKFVLARA